MYWPCGVPRIYVEKGHVSHRNGADEVEERTSCDDGGDHEIDSSDEPFGRPLAPKKSERVEKGPESILDIKLSRSEYLFVTVTASTLTVWQGRPMLALAKVGRSESSLETYGANLKVLLCPDPTLAIIQTAHGYLLTYSLDWDPTGRVYQQHVDQSHARRQSLIRQYGTDEVAGYRELTVRFTRAIKIDAGISAVLALDLELVVSTSKPPAVHCLGGTSSDTSPQARAELLSKMDWMLHKSIVTSMVHDRAIGLSVWTAQDGRSYAVHRTQGHLSKPDASDESLASNNSSSKKNKLFQGYCFHEPKGPAELATEAAINARFSLLAVSCANSQVRVYTAKDYAGNIRLSHEMRMPASSATTGNVNCLCWSPDGYALFAGYENGWAIWSVFGKEVASSFQSNLSMAENNKERWLLGITTATWSSGGSEILLTSPGDNRIWKMEFSRSASTGLFSCANFVRALLQTPSELIIYRGHDMPDLTSISNDASLWHHAPFPLVYLHNQWPIKSCVISQDGRYVAAAGRRGLSHYSVQSGRWKTFRDQSAENAFAVRGGMVWFGHVLVAATESPGACELRLYSRDTDLTRSSTLYVEALAGPVVFVGPSGEDSLLVYTYENILYHYIVTSSPQGASLVQVGQIAFHGVVRTPTRVRSVSWILPVSQLRDGDPSRDVEYASVLFLVDDKLVLLQPSWTADGALKYEMRVIAQQIEYYILTRDQVYFNFGVLGDDSAPPTPIAGTGYDRRPAQQALKDSLWTFGGNDLRLWSDMPTVLFHGHEDSPSTSNSMLSIPVDFYPLSILLNKGIVLGIESELNQRRDVNFAQFQSTIRTHLFIPYLLRHQLHLDAQNLESTLALASEYNHLSYFPHALEVLLHNVLDDEADGRSQERRNADPSKDDSLLPSILSLLQKSLATTSYLSTVVQCIRKTELSFWQTLFVHLPDPVSLFEEALQLNDLQTASGYLIVLHGLEEEEEVFDNKRLESFVVRLMVLAKEQANFELCGELARFMIALDPGGTALIRVMQSVGFRSISPTILTQAPQKTGLGLRIPTVNSSGEKNRRSREEIRSCSPRYSTDSGGDYFSPSPGGL